MSREILLTQPVLERICSNLNIEEANSLRISLNLKSLACSLTIIDPKTSRKIVLPEINAQIQKVHSLILKNGLDVALISAISEPNKNLRRQLVLILLKLGVNVNIQDQADENFFPLLMAVAKQDFEIVEILLNAGADINLFEVYGFTALMSAAANLNENILLLLLKKGAGKINIEAVDTSGNTALMVAAQRGRNKNVKILAAAGANINATNRYGETALIMASREGRKEVVQTLISLGADIHIQDIGGHTAFSIAVLLNEKGVAEILLKAGANVNHIYRDGGSLLRRTVEQENIEMIKFLLDVGANVNILDRDGSTALMMAAYFKSVEIAKMLIDRRANVNIANERGTTALKIAINNHDDKLVQLLRKVGAH